MILGQKCIVIACISIYDISLSLSHTPLSLSNTCLSHVWTHMPLFCVRAPEIIALDDTTMVLSLLY